MIVQRHPHAKEYHLINHHYDVESLIKDAEHQKRNLLFIGGAKNVYPSQNDPVSPLRKFNMLIQLTKFACKNISLKSYKI